MSLNLEEMRQKGTIKMKEVKCQEEQEVIKRGEKVNRTGRTEAKINLMMGRDTRNYQCSSYKSQLQSKTGKVSAESSLDPDSQRLLMKELAMRHFKSDCGSKEMFFPFLRSNAG